MLCTIATSVKQTTKVVAKTAAMYPTDAYAAELSWHFLHAPCSEYQSSMHSAHSEPVAPVMHTVPPALDSKLQERTREGVSE